ncbi:phospholipase [Arthrobacter sp. fls2-241-R2A-200]|uniref:alpha/beta hydrolase n=1 Tax=Arthrobacter sp. fls2-241-R2A-200 TaxID=3040281 RepID=UPI00254F6E64|nr:phospholipase [Arthrobacter sp. fls2-241-R2A-200]
MDSVVWSKPEKERPGTPLLVMLHGYGTSEQRMANLFPHLPGEFTCAALRGPKMIGDGHGWFLLDYFLTNDFADVITSTNRVFDWINSVKGEHSSVCLLGYSQGMAMASTLLRLRPKEFAATVGLSGFVMDNDLLGLSESFDTPPPFFWGRDKADPVINQDAIAHTKEWLNANTALTARTYPGMGHRIGQAELVDVSAFLKYYALNQRI